ncbi:ATP-binding protein [Pseudooceanicola sp. HF7]|uniref:sensor histidine kinase n=1 Tax=Pseudooceanicola sp. HF7 TaxID=2721560 RepID=UPI00142F8C01|nr:ATP-binding protein [Pseudooceanicola sp. HF7]NIZ11199.1 hypothetical protein [Pseudooceanicola sp. HF7]
MKDPRNIPGASRDAVTDPPGPETSGKTASDEVEDLIYVITHDLRGTFRAIQIIPDFLAEDLSPLPEGKQELLESHVAMLKTMAQRCDRMLVDLRDYSRVGRCADPPGDHAIAPLLQETTQRHPLPPGFRLTLTGAGILTGPRNELSQLFAVLLSNAVKHHDRDSGLIEVSVTSQGPLRRISIRDDGPGIRPDLREKAFGILSTLKSRDTCEGSGMGLPIARKIVTRLGGTIDIADSQGARGTEITFTLPGHARQ